ncbi:hypothetical protein K4K61_012376 [Colletotrichum sp. SAR11_59]|nr:hypothetical protein K4K61_012376 [Colletotrichum sp. SAR11_59]
MRTSSLPPTFREAVYVARGMGFSHIWIDSLCIIQDDKEDWKAEARRMAIIYDNATCTIVAMDGLDSEAGLNIQNSELKRAGVLDSRAWLGGSTSTRDFRLPRAIPKEENEWEDVEEEEESEEDPDEDDELEGANHEGDDMNVDSSEDAVEDDDHEGSNEEAEDSSDEKSTEWKSPQLTSRMTVRITKALVSTTKPTTATAIQLTEEVCLGMLQIFRWTHLRSSFGLFYHFFETEMLWYVDPKGPSGERQKPWLVPTWSWASTRNGSVVNDMYRRLPMRGSLMIKPEIKMGMGTAFDQPLPFAAWMARRYHTLEMKGDLRKGVVTATPGINGEIKYTTALDKLGRFSDEEVHDFRPDCAEEFPIGQSVNVLYMVWYHYDADYWKLDKHIDVGLVFKQMKGETEITMYEEDVAKESTSEQRLLTRLGYLETTYPTGSRRNMAEVMEELTWYFVRVA